MPQIDNTKNHEIGERENNKMEVRRELSELAKEHPEISALIEREEVIELCAKYKQTPQLLGAHEIMRMFGKSSEDEQYTIDLHRELSKKTSDRDESLIKTCLDRFGIKTVIHAEGPTVWDHVRESTNALNKSELTPEQLRLWFLSAITHDIGKLEAVDLQNTNENTKRRADVAKNGTLVMPMIGHASEKIVPKSFITMREMFDRMVEDEVLTDVESNALIMACAEHMNNLPKVPETLPNAQEIKNPDTSIIAYIDNLGDTDEKRTAALAMIITTKKMDGIGTYTYTYDKENDSLVYTNSADEVFPSPKKIMAYYLLNKEAQRLKEEAAERSRKLMEISKLIFGGKELPQIVTELGIDKKLTGKVKQAIEQYIIENNLLHEKPNLLADHAEKVIERIKQAAI